MLVVGALVGEVDGGTMVDVMAWQDGKGKLLGVGS